METNRQEITLEEILKRKEETLLVLRKQREQINTTAKNLFSPPKALNKTDAFMNSINSGIAIFDGVMLGMKVIKRIRRIFRR